MFNRSRSLSAVLALVVTCLFPAIANSDDAIEKAGVGVGVTAGNMLFLPIKAIAVTVGIFSGALSYVVTGGNSDLTKQIWQDTTEGPYVITPDVARMGVGQRPELEMKK
jgi:hypothetical protein